MTIPCFLDSNIWLYSFMETDEPKKTSNAHSIIQNKENKIIVSTQVINEICVNLIKKLNFNELDIEKLILDFYKKYTVYKLNKKTLLKASELRNKHKFSFWDSMIISSALCSNAKILYSEDLQDGFILNKILTIKNPFNSDNPI